MADKYKKLKNIFSLLSFLCTVGPLVYFLISAVLNGEVKASEKVGLAFSVVVCAILVALNAIKKYRLRSPVYILIIGLQICLKNLLVVFVVLAITTILDEFIFTPLKRKYREKYIINKEIDSRNE